VIGRDRGQVTVTFFLLAKRVYTMVELECIMMF
jgi:hypothetical protein